MSRWLFATFNAVTDSESFLPNDFPSDTFTVVWPGRCAGPPLSVNPEPYDTLEAAKAAALFETRAPS